MAIDTDLSIISSGYNLSKINDNFQDISEKLERALSRYNDSPNQMETDLDMNGKNIINIGSLGLADDLALSDFVTHAQEWANKAEDSLVSTAAGGDGVDDYSALHHANKAGVSATNAATSAVNAATSATEAANSAAEASSIVAAMPYKDAVFVTVANSPYTVGGADSGKLLAVDTTGGNVVINLPLISTIGEPFNILVRKEDSSTNTVTINRNGTNVINAADTSLIISSQYSGYTLQAEDDSSPNKWFAYATSTVGDGTVTAEKLVQTASGLENIITTINGATNKFGSAQVLPTGRTTARTLKQRAGDVFNVLDFGADNTNVADSSAAIQSAIGAAIAAGHGAVYIPAGNYKLLSTIGVNPSTARVRIYGDGPATKLRPAANMGDIFQLGFTGQPKGYHWSIEDLTILFDATPSSGAAFHVRNFTRLAFKNIRIQNNVGVSFNAWKLGDDAVNDDVTIIDIDHCYVEAGTSAAIDLRSGAILTVTDCMFNGGGTTYLIEQNSGAAKNWDGLTFRGNTCEQWASAIFINGLGVSNLRVSDNIMDRPLVNNAIIWLTPQAGGTVQHVSITGNQFQGTFADNVTRGIRISQLGALKAITIQGNHFFGLGCEAIRLDDRTSGTAGRAITITGNAIYDCGFYTGASTSLIHIGAYTSCTATGNVGDTVDNSGYEYGINWSGTGVARGSSNNKFNNFAISAETGTP